ncbi:hypothetical protein GOBAR_DD30747 [Gossypium barbadense]|nr:hypothetical protein GOBAR_DD30747 [Gossypium barbadense]
MSEFTRYSRVLLLMVLGLSAGACYGFGTFGFEFHHRYSDPVKQILAVDELPAKGSLEYYSAMIHRDKIIKGRRLAAENDQTPVTFLDGNATYRLSSLGYLHYANVTVGTPALWFLVALDTGSDLFWLPCDCSSCVQGIESPGGPTIEFNIYSPNTSSTSSKVPCSSDKCEQYRKCSSPTNTCPYQVIYLSNGTSSIGVLVEDVLHLTTDDDKTNKPVEAKITFGFVSFTSFVLKSHLAVVENSIGLSSTRHASCGKIQTGSFLNGAAPNGLFGLGMDNISVPSILAKENVTSNSFSMCFRSDGIGRITFGDKGSSDQGETPINLRQSRPTYNISITQINVGGNTGDLEFDAIFDSGTSFTYLNDPAYTLISETFNNLALDKRHTSKSTDDLPFEYCYELSANQTSLKYPVVNLTMKGGDQLLVNDPIAVLPMQGGGVYCLAVVKSDSVNIIGRYNIETSNTLPVIPPSAVPPATAVKPEATARNSSNAGAPGSSPPPMTNKSTQLKALSYVFTIALVLYFALI